VAATSKAAQLRETLPTTSRVVGSYENHVIGKFDSLRSKNLNSELKKEESYICDPSKCGVEGLPGALGRGPYVERCHARKFQNLECDSNSLNFF
jgi:hypothetical protein